MNTIDVAVAGGSITQTPEAEEQFKAIMALIFQRAAAAGERVEVHVSFGFGGDTYIAQWCRSVDPSQGRRTYMAHTGRASLSNRPHEEKRRHEELLSMDPQHIICMPGGKGLWRFVALCRERGYGDRLILIDKRDQYEEAA